MARSGDRFSMPGAGEYAVVTSHDEANGEYVEMEWTLPPGAFAPPAHRHPAQVEEYEVLEGRLDVNIGGTWQTLGPGESASVPVNVAHTFRVPEGGPVRVHNFHRPGARFDTFIEKQAGFANSPRFKGLKHPSTAMFMSMVWREHADMIVASNPLMRAAMAALARIGRLRGWRTDAP